MEREIKTEAEAQRRSSMVATEEKKRKIATREEGEALQIVIDFTRFLIGF
jgi:hypothetical protein